MAGHQSSGVGVAIAAIEGLLESQAAVCHGLLETGVEIVIRALQWRRPRARHRHRLDLGHRFRFGLRLSRLELLVLLVE